MASTHRRRVRGVAAAVLFALVATGCSSDGTSDEPSPAPGTDTDAGEAIADDGDAQAADVVLDVVVPTEPPSMDPVVLPQSTGIVWGAFMEELIGLSSSGQPDDSGLLTSWERVDDKTWSFTLRDGVTFHDGSPFDAEAAKFTVETYRDTSGSPMAPFLSEITEVTVVDEGTIEVVTATPDLSIPAQLTAVRALPPGAYTEMGADAFGRAPVGTGPYAFEEWSSGTEIRGSAYEDYWQGTPGSEEISITFAADGQTRASLVQTGQADLAFAIPVQLREELESAEDTSTVEVVTQSLFGLFLVTTGDQLADRELRDAIALAMDREGLVEGVLDGQGGVPTASLLGGLLSEPADPEVPAPDTETASSIVSEAGNPQITFSYSPDQYANGQALAEAIAGMLEGVGFDVQRNPLDYGTLNNEFIGGTLDGIVMYAPLPVFPHPQVFTEAFLTTASITKACDAEGIDELATQGIAAEDLETSDEIYREIEELGIEEARCFIPLFNEVQTYGIDAGLTGLEPPPAVVPDYFPVTLS